MPALLPAPYKKHVLALLRDYIQIQLDVSSRDLGVASAAVELGDVITQSSDVIQEAHWRKVQVIAASDKSMIPIVFLQSHNAMIDNQERRLVTITHYPPAAASRQRPAVIPITKRAFCEEPRRPTIYVAGFLFLPHIVGDSGFRSTAEELYYR